MFCLSLFVYLFNYFLFVVCLLHRVATNLENVEKSGNLKVVREKSGKIGKVGENGKSRGKWEKSGKMCSCLWCASYNTFQ